MFVNASAEFFRNDIPLAPILFYAPIFLMIAIMVPFSACTSWLLFREDKTRRYGLKMSKSTTILVRFYSAGRNVYPYQAILADAKTKDSIVIGMSEPEEMASKIIEFIDKCCANNPLHVASSSPVYMISHDSYKQMVTFAKVMQHAEKFPRKFVIENTRFIDLRNLLIAENVSKVDFSMKFKEVVHELYPWLSILRGGFLPIYMHLFDKLYREKNTRAMLYNKYIVYEGFSNSE